MGIDIPGAVPVVLRSWVTGIPQMLRHLPRFSCSHVSDGCIYGAIRRVRLRGCRKVHRRLRQDDAPLRHPNKGHRIRRCLGNHESLGIRHSDIFRGEDDHTSGNKPGILSRHHHAGQVMQRRVHIGTPDRFNESANDVIVLVAIFVISNQSRIHSLRSDVRGDRPTLTCGPGHSFEDCQRLTGIGSRHSHNVLTRLWRQVNRAGKSSRVRECPVDKSPNRGIVQRMQRQQQTAAEQRAHNGKRGIFCGCRHQGNPAIFHGRQKSILLGLSEAMHLIDKENSRVRPRSNRTFRCLNNRSDIFHSGSNGTQFHKGPCPCDKVGEGRFTCSRGTPQDDGRRGMVGLY